MGNKVLEILLDLFLCWIFIVVIVGFEFLDCEVEFLIVIFMGSIILFVWLIFMFVDIGVILWIVNKLFFDFDVEWFVGSVVLFI